ncbi:DUF349 domain-containing protein [Reichenbachiella sp. MALMAid0571]|uniref:DUF349 domain-containing protein n=1 Tax=Reichenbachiella sp. MALMAid0571 TaxID=3143939 RepID=UPI0032DFD3AA
MKLAEKEIPYGFIQDNKIFRTGVNGGNPIVLRDCSEESKLTVIKELEEAYKKFLSEFIQIENRILGTENKGSFLAKLINLKDRLQTHSGLGDYDSIFNKITLYENQIEDLIQSNRKRNTEIKQALILELEQALKNNDFHEAGVTIKDIRTRWIKTGNAEDSVNKELENRFSEMTQSFFDKRQSFFDDKKKLTDSRINKYDSVISELEEIIRSKDLHKHTSKVSQLQKDWQTIGHVPIKEYKVRNEKYWSLCKEFYKDLKVDRQKSAVKEDVKGNLKLKQAIIEQFQELEKKSLHQDTKLSVETAKKMWKSIGRVPKDQVEVLNKSYLSALDSISEKAFIFQLANRKFKGFVKKDVEERNKLLNRLVKELLTRDKSELETFKMNLDNMHVNKGSFVDMLEKKLQNQEKRVLAKKSILKELQFKKTEGSKK